MRKMHLKLFRLSGGNREKAKQKQIESGKSDQGERASVTAGNNMNGFIVLMLHLVKANGLQMQKYIISAVL